MRREAVSRKRRHHDLLAWELSIQLVRRIYELTQAFPPTETYGLVTQMRRAAISIPSNIAEGAARHSTKEFAQFLVVARGSLSELETQLLISRQLGFASADETLDELIDRVFGLIGGLINANRQERPHV